VRWVFSGWRPSDRSGIRSMYVTGGCDVDFQGSHEKRRWKHELAWGHAKPLWSA
jgi:hypothetical protein